MLPLAVSVLALHLLAPAARPSRDGRGIRHTPLVCVEPTPGLTGYFAENEVKRLTVDPSRFSHEFIEGDRVEVVKEVLVKGGSTLGMCGTVTNVWVICETDPACCCAELAFDAPLTVQLDAPGGEPVKTLT